MEHESFDKLTNKSDSRQLLTFVIKGQEYAIDIHSVQEIRRWETATPIPNAPDFVKGIINIRGDIIPIIELSKQLDGNETLCTHHTVLIIIKVLSQTKQKTVGILADAVSDVINVTDNDIQPPPEWGKDQRFNFLQGLTQINDLMVIVLNMDLLLGTDFINSEQLTQIVSEIKNQQDNSLA